MPLKECIKTAFDVRDYSLDEPGWIDSVALDIVAKPPAGMLGRFNEMLQTLLVERFRIVFHWESRVMNGYAVVQAKGGMKSPNVKNPEGGGGKGSFGSSDGLIWGNAVTTAQFADMLAHELNHPVQDRTGDARVFDFRLTWTPEGTQRITTAASEPVTVADPGPSLPGALQEQLGLKLEKSRLAVNVLVIDQINRVPIEN
jgi:uncharacterized protein (TIGR03435 family)